VTSSGGPSSMRKANLISLGKLITLGTAVVALAFARLFWLPGLTFNSENWDDEIGWLKDSSSRSPIEYLFYRDAPGYFVLIPRLLILIGKVHPYVGEFSSLRLIVILVQFICFATAAACVVKWHQNWKLWILIFSTLSLTYIEDLNYIHNIGYIFIFPIFLFTFARILNNRNIPFVLLFAGMMLISKPFTAVIVILLSMVYFVKFKQQQVKLFFLGGYSFVYLVSYIVLPHRWNTPFNLDFATLIKIGFDFPWILFSSLFPAISIGALGILRIINQPFLRDIFGVSVYLLWVLIVWKHRKWIRIEILKVSRLTSSLFCIFLINYFLVFSGGDSFWIKSFPLFRLDSPQFLWARWSSVIPLVFVTLIVSLANIPLKFRSYLLIMISTQWFFLSILGQSWLRRYW
jgi:hypothetical protein